jgi:hypothetical protein
VVLPFDTHTYVTRQETELANNIRKATSIEEVSPKRTFLQSAKAMRRNLPYYRKACARMHCVYMGSQELPELLAGHESVGLTPTVSDIDLISLSHVEAFGTHRPLARWLPENPVYSVGIDGLRIGRRAGQKRPRAALHFAIMT